MTTYTGPDVSSFQGGIDCAAIKAAGHSFVIIKATQGTGYTNPSLGQQVASARKAGLPIGLYHFLDGSDPTAQAARFLSIAARLVQPGDLPLVFDFETNPGGGGSPTHAGLDQMRRIVRTAGFRTMTYTYPAWWAAAGDSSCRECASDPLWLARYGPVPTTPQPWSHWAMWQRSNADTSVPGWQLDMSQTDNLAALTGSTGDPNDMADITAAQMDQIADKVLGRPIQTGGGTVQGVLVVAANQAAGANQAAQAAGASIAALTATVQALSAALTQSHDTPGTVDAAAITASVKAAVDNALADLKVTLTNAPPAVTA